MIKIKHFMDPVEADDGARVWVEPFGLTLDLRQLCSVTHVLPRLGPPRDVWHWFQNNPGGYEYFRGRYHEHLGRSRHKPALQRLANATMQENITLLHQGDAALNTGVALHEFLSELGAFCPPEL